MNYAASTLQKAEKTVVVDYPSGDIKIAIGKLFTVLSAKYNPMKNGVNDVMGTYQFSIQNNLNPAICDVSIEALSDVKTKITLVVTAAYGSMASNSILAGLLNDYLAALTKSITGESLEQEEQKASSDGCIWGIIIGMMLIIALAVLMSSLF